MRHHSTFLYACLRKISCNSVKSWKCKMRDYHHLLRHNGLYFSIVTNFKIPLASDKVIFFTLKILMLVCLLCELSPWCVKVHDLRAYLVSALICPVLYGIFCTFRLGSHLIQMWLTAGVRCSPVLCFRDELDPNVCLKWSQIWKGPLCNSLHRDVWTSSIERWS